MSERASFECQTFDGDVLTLRLIGDLDSAAAPEFQSHLQTCRASDYNEILIDCRDLRYISSLGLGAFVALHSRVCRHGGVVKLAGMQEQVGEVFRTTRLDSLFLVYPDVESAKLLPSATA
jgi:anti-anti-sigma factor